MRAVPASFIQEPRADGDKGSADESPFALLVKGLKDRGIATGKVGLDENMKFVFSNSLAQAGPQLTFVVATPVTAGCRMI